jgi:MFS family permease
VGGLLADKVGRKSPLWFGSGGICLASVTSAFCVNLD